MDIGKKHLMIAGVTLFAGIALGGYYISRGIEQSYAQNVFKDFLESSHLNTWVPMFSKEEVPERWIYKTMRLLPDPTAKGSYANLCKRLLELTAYDHYRKIGTQIFWSGVYLGDYFDFSKRPSSMYQETLGVDVCDSTLLSYVGDRVRSFVENFSDLPDRAQVDWEGYLSALAENQTVSLSY